MNLVLVGLGGALGAMARYGAGIGIGKLIPGAFPYATLLVNIAGALGMGLLVGVLSRIDPHWQEPARLFLAVGILGGFTTFSAFSLDAVLLLERGEPVQALAYVLLSVVVCLAALYLGLVVSRGGL